MGEDAAESMNIHPPLYPAADYQLHNELSVVTMLGL